MSMVLKLSQPAEPTLPGLAARLVLMVGAALRVDGELSQQLAREGVRCLWLRSTTEALEAARLARFDAVVLDAALHDAHAVPTLSDLKQRLGCPIVVVADYADEVDEIVALEMGADAYLVRPLAPRRLRAHLMALMRSAPPPHASVLAGAKPIAPAAGRAAPVRECSFNGWSLDMNTGRLTGRGRQVELTVVQCVLMQHLMDAAGRVVSSSQLTAALPGGDQLDAHSVYVYITRLRRRLAEAGVHELCVEAVRGRGFALRTVNALARQPAAIMQAA